MLIGKIQPPTLEELFINKIEDQIFSGRLKPGDKLPTERQLQQETGISRSVIHSALVTLEKKGFIEIRNRSGAYVLDYTTDGTLEALNAEIRHNGGAMAKNQVKDFFECKDAIVGGAIQKLAASHSEDDLAILKNILDNAEAAAEKNDFDTLTMLLFDFDRTLCRLSGNDFYPLLINEFKPIILGFWEDSLTTTGAEININALRKLLRDIENHSGDRALARLLRNSESYLSNL